MKYVNAWHIFRTALEAEFIGKTILSNDGIPFKVDAVQPELQSMDGYVEVIFYDSTRKIFRNSNEIERLPEIWPENLKV